MITLMRIVFSVLATIIGWSVLEGGFRLQGFEFIGMLIVIFWGIPISLFTIFILWPAELALRRAGFAAATLIAAPALGFLGPYCLLLFAPNHDNAIYGLAGMRLAGLLCGGAWALTYWFSESCARRASRRYGDGAS